jgi:hypothetical protein
MHRHKAPYELELMPRRHRGKIKERLGKRLPITDAKRRQVACESTAQEWTVKRLLEYSIKHRRQT